MFEFELKMAFMISSIVHGYYVYIQKAEIITELPCSPEQIIAKIVRGVAGMNGTDLDNHSFCCFEATSIASLVALIEADASVLDNGPSGSGNVLGL